MLPSVIYILLTTLASSFFAVYGLVLNNNTILIVSTLLAPTSDAIYSIIKNFIITKNKNIINIILYLIIAIFVPLIIGIISGYLLEAIKLKHNNEKITIPSTNMEERLEYSAINIGFNILTPIVCCLFLPYALEKNNIGLIIAISIGLSFVTPLVTIGLYIGSNKHTPKDYTIHDYVIPIINFIINFLSIIIISFIMIKYLGFDKKY
jgi:hypothetical protein